MSKASFIKSIAKRYNLPVADAKRAVSIVFEEIIIGMKELKKNNKFSLGTIGTFHISKRKARRGRNPRTGAEIKIKDAKVLKFRPSIRLKAAAGTARGKK